MTTLADILLKGAERFGPREAVADPGGTVTYAELAAGAGRLARALRATGARPGDRSAVVLPNSIAFVRAHFANLLAGLVSVPCDASVTAESFAALAAQACPRILLTDEAGLKRLAAAAPIAAAIEKIFVIDGAGPWSDPRVGSAAAALAAEPDGVFCEQRAPGDLAALMYTTGATGGPKGVMLTHENVLAALRSIVEFVRYTPDDREVVILPLSHNFGLGHVYCNLMSGGAVYTENGLVRVGRVLKALESFRATGFPGTPMGFGMLLDQYGPVLASKGAKLRFCVVNSAPLPPERTAQLQTLLPRLDIMVYYGLTEASRSAFISLTRSGPDHYRAVGKPLPHVELEIRGSSGGRAPAGETGEVVVRGPAVARGYWADEAQTAAAFPDGWLHTGDLGHLDASGCLWITGRLKDLINVGGYKVHPGEVEKVVGTFPAVHDTGAVGLEGLGGLTGEAIVAAVVLRPGHGFDEAGLQRFCLERLEKFKVPARFVAVAEIPRSDTGKVKRADLARLVAVQLAAGPAKN